MMKLLLNWLVASAAAESAAATATNLTSGLADLPLMSKGLVVTLAGLAGVFLVLLLFFLMIKIMQKAGKK